MLFLMVIIETTAFMVLMVLVLRLMILMLIMETTMLVLMLMLISRGSTDSGIRSDDQLEIQVLL